MNIKAEFINRLAKFIVGGVPYESAKHIVQTVERKDISGYQKKAIAMSELKNIGYQLSKFGIDVAVTLAWMWLEIMANRALKESGK